MSDNLIKKIYKSTKPLLIFICGMPGTRKSSTAVRLGGMLGFAAVIGMDEVRDVMLLYDKSPILNGKSHNHWKLFGPLNKENFKKGFFGHCRALKKGTMAILNKTLSIGENTIVEGVHVIPSLYKNIPNAKTIHFVLTANDFTHHKELLGNKFGRRHKRQDPWNDNKVKHVEQIQELLLEDAKNHDVFIIKSGTAEENCKKIINIIKKNI